MRRVPKGMGGGRGPTLFFSSPMCHGDGRGNAVAVNVDSIIPLRVSSVSRVKRALPRGCSLNAGDGVDRRRWRTTTPCASWYRRLVVLITWCTPNSTTPILPVSRSPLLSTSRTDLRLPEKPSHAPLRGRCRRASACICGCRETHSAATSW